MGGKRLYEFSRIEIISLSHQNFGYKKIAAQTGYSVSTIRDVLKRWEFTGDYLAAPLSGRPTILSKHDRRRLVQDIIDNLFKNLASLHADTCLPVCQRTIDRMIKDEGFDVYISVKKSWLDAEKEAKRLELAKTYVDEPLISIRNIAFS